MKRGWLAVALLVVMAALALWHVWYLNGLTGELAAALERAEGLAESRDWQGAGVLTRQAQDRWDGASILLHITLDHEVMDEVSVGFAETLEYLQMEEREEYSAANARLIERLELLGDMERPSVENLL